MLYKLTINGWGFVMQNLFKNLWSILISIPMTSVSRHYRSKNKSQPSYHTTKATCTPPNFRFCAWWKVPGKSFKICHICMKTENATPFFILLFFIFSLMNALVYVDIDTGHSLGKNIKLHEMKNEKNYMGFLIHKI